MFSCETCSKEFINANALRAHYSRDHCHEIVIDFGNNVTISVARVQGQFRCPISTCKKEYSNVDSFRKHANAKHPVCNVTTADCDTTPAPKRRKIRTTNEQITKGQGCDEALKLGDEARSSHFATGLACDPAVLHMCHETMVSPLRLSVLANSTDLHHACLMLPFESRSLTSPVECQLQLPDDKFVIHPAAPAADQQAVVAGDEHPMPLDSALVMLRRVVGQSWLPNLLDKSEYEEASGSFLAALHYDIRLRPDLLRALAKLLTGAIIVDKEVILMITTEAYGRAKSVDVHGETNLKTIPQGTAPDDLVIGIFEEADGHAIKNKLKIGAPHWNILSTMSVCLQQKPSLDIGPSTSVLIDSIKPGRSRLFFNRQNIQEFMAIFDDEDHVFTSPTISSVRQVLTSFEDSSTFGPWRATISSLSNDLLMPATIFTLCDLPHHQGYGSSNLSTDKLASRFLQAHCAAHLLSKAPDFSTALALFDGVTKARDQRGKTSKEWTKLATNVEALRKILSKEPELSVQTLSMLHDFSEMASLAASRLHDCNLKLKENVQNQLTRLYGNFD